MIYDTPITVLKLPPGVGTAFQGKLQKVFSAYCGETVVFHNRFWESVQAGSRVDVLVQLPLHRPVTAGMFAKYKDHIYSIEQAQFPTDEDGLPVTVLSLKQSEGRYDIAGI